MEKLFIGYHGTPKKDGVEILKSMYFRFSCDEEEWLGKGIYFFEDDIQQAINFCTRARCYPNWMVIKSEIRASIVIDLIKTEDFNEFRKIAITIKNKHLKTADGKPKKLLNSVVLNMMYKIKPYEVVRCAFPVPGRGVIERTNIGPTQIQLCVRERKCICTIEEEVC